MTSTGITCAPVSQGPIANEKWGKNRDFHEDHMFSFFLVHNCTKLVKTMKLQLILHLYFKQDLIFPSQADDCRASHTI
jgi:hypothetical protein